MNDRTCKPKSRKPGRPRGRQHDAMLHVRLPRPALEAIRELARRSRKSIAEVVRSGVVANLVAAIQPAVSVAQDRRAAASRRLAAIQLLDLVAEAGLYLTDYGLTIARQEAQKDD